MPTDPRIEQYQSASIRDLAWAILSPTLMLSPDASHNCAERWFNDAFTAIAPHLQQLDQDDSPLVHHLHEPANRRLGLYFERLWSYWLQHNERYRLLASNLQVMDNGVTLGEFDCIVHDTAADEIEHWELAVKFYLGIPPLAAAQHWFGPHVKDRLDRKFRHLVDKQLPLSQTRPGQLTCQQQGWTVTRRRLISKGRLYYPWPHHDQAPACIDPRHLHGYWMGQSEWRRLGRQYRDAGYSWLDKSEWLVWRPRPLHTAREIHERLERQLHSHPVQLHVEGWHEVPLRLFLVPDHWQEHALATLRPDGQ